LVDKRTGWRRIGDAVARRPVAFIAGTLALLTAMALGLTQFSLGLAADEQFLDEPEAITAATRLAESFPAGSSDPAVVVTATEDEQVVAGLVADLEALDEVLAASVSAQGGGVTQV